MDTEPLLCVRAHRGLGTLWSAQGNIVKVPLVCVREHKGLRTLGVHKGTYGTQDPWHV